MMTPDDKPRSRFTAKDHASALAELAVLLIKHRGDVGKVKAALDDELELARMQARYGYKVPDSLADEDTPPTDLH